MGLLDFFTNKKATKKGKVEVEAPAFSLTKVAGGLGTLITGIAVAAAKVEEAAAVKVAVIGGAALVMVAYFGLAAVDLVVRQRASEAKRRWPKDPDAKGQDDSTDKPAAGSNGDGKVVLVGESDDLVLQERHSGQEFEVRYLEIDGDQVTMVARRDGRTLTATFQRP